MDDFRKRLIHIHHCRGVGWKTLLRLLRNDQSLKSVYSMDVTSLIKTFSMKKNNAQTFYHDLHTYSYEDIFAKYKKDKITIITRFDEEYPPLLKEIYDPPWVLYCKGNHTYLKNLKLISVVGTRDPSRNGLRSLNKLMMPLLKEDWIIISGMALGIDTVAHHLAIENNGKTIAVLGSGFYHVYPKSHQPMANTIEKRGNLLVSEYPPYVKPQKWHFPMRNRIISGLSKGTIVIEAKEKSGSLITADQALQQGREVFAVPGSIFEERSIGTNQLIQQGAKLVINTDDILTELNRQI